MKLRVTTKRENNRGKGMEVPCMDTTKALFYAFVKAEPLIKDLCDILLEIYALISSATFTLTYTIPYWSLRS